MDFDLIHTLGRKETVARKDDGAVICCKVIHESILVLSHLFNKSGGIGEVQWEVLLLWERETVSDAHSGSSDAKQNIGVGTSHSLVCLFLM